MTNEQKQPNSMVNHKARTGAVIGIAVFIVIAIVATGVIYIRRQRRNRAITDSCTADRLETELLLDSDEDDARFESRHACA